MSRINFFKSVLFGIPIGMTLLDCVGYIARVEGISMQPSLNPDENITDYVFLSRWPIISSNIKRGDVVSLISPKDPDQKIIKRIVGLPGDIISTIGYKSPVIKIPEGHCWVEGDHTGYSYDSNTFGPISIGLMTAKAVCIVWPPSRWQNLQSDVPKQRKPILIGKLNNQLQR